MPFLTERVEQIRPNGALALVDEWFVQPTHDLSPKRLTIRCSFLRARFLTRGK